MGALCQLAAPLSPLPYNPASGLPASALPKRFPAHPGGGSALTSLCPGQPWEELCVLRPSSQGGSTQDLRLLVPDQRLKPGSLPRLAPLSNSPSTAQAPSASQPGDQQWGGQAVWARMSWHRAPRTQTAKALRGFMGAVPVGSAAFFLVASLASF